ncbi:MAG: hypothetical protein WAN14_18245, partial [Candidatus Acidiferrales bacterium]
MRRRDLSSISASGERSSGKCSTDERVTNDSSPNLVQSVTSNSQHHRDQRMNVNMNGTPRIESVKPAAALPGGEVAISGTGFATRNHTRPLVQFGVAEGSLILAADNLLIAR